VHRDISKPRASTSVNSSRLKAIRRPTAQRERRPYDYGKAICPQTRARLWRYHNADLGTSSPIFCIASFENSRSSAFLSRNDADQAHLYFSRTPRQRFNSKSARLFHPGKKIESPRPATFPRSMRMISSRNSRVTVNVSPVGKLGIGHDGGRISSSPAPLQSFSLSALQACVPGNQTPRLSNDDGPRAGTRIFEMSCVLALL